MRQNSAGARLQLTSGLNLINGCSALENALFIYTSGIDCACPGFDLCVGR